MNANDRKPIGAPSGDSSFSGPTLKAKDDPLSDASWLTPPGAPAGLVELMAEEDEPEADEKAPVVPPVIQDVELPPLEALSGPPPAAEPPPDDWAALIPQ
jgi:hypothetical protein